MSFDDLPPQDPINPRADAYAAEALKISRATAEQTRCLLDVKYGDDYWQKIDVYLPKATGHRDLPVFLFFHGGGMTSGYKEWCGFMAPAFVERPAIFISASYRLIPHVTWPKPHEDAIAALKWVWDNIGAHGGSRDRIVVGGHSAGSMLTALMPLYPEWTDRAGLPRDAVKACMCLSGTFNRRSINEKHTAHVQPGPETAIQPDSPIALTPTARPRTPFYIAWGGNEHERLARTGKQMIEELQKVGCPVESDVFPGNDHFSVHLKTRDPKDAWSEKVWGYLARTAAKAKVA